MRQTLAEADTIYLNPIVLGELRDRFALQFIGTRSRSVEAAQQIQQGRLSGTAWPHYGDVFA